MSIAPASARAAAPQRASVPSVLVVSGVVTLLIVVWMLADLGGWSYYRTPLGVRGYATEHARLRPSGTVGHALGILGFLMMLVPVAYTIRKRSRALARLGRLDLWLAVHVFCGIVGPVLVTFHTAFRFNGLVSVAYWSMLAVVLSGFVGRYLFVRIPRGIRGAELSYAEIRERANALRARLEPAAHGSGAPAALDAFERTIVPSKDARWAPGTRVGWLRRRRLVSRLRRELRAAGIGDALLGDAVELAVERAYLLRRLTYLETTRRLFAMWHVFHQPLVYLMFAIAGLHVAVAMYLGYAFW